MRLQNNERAVFKLYASRALRLQYLAFQIGKKTNRERKTGLKIKCNVLRLSVFGGSLSPKSVFSTEKKFFNFFVYRKELAIFDAAEESVTAITWHFPRPTTFDMREKAMAYRYSISFLLKVRGI